VSPLDQLAAETLMKTLGVIVLHEFPDQVAQMSLAENHKVIQALVLYRFHKPLRVRIGVGRRLHLMGTMRVKPFG
jgi:hypothetical protein